VRGGGEGGASNVRIAGPRSAHRTGAPKQKQDKERRGQVSCLKKKSSYQQEYRQHEGNRRTSRGNVCGIKGKRGLRVISRKGRVQTIAEILQGRNPPTKVSKQETKLCERKNRWATLVK